MQPGSILFILKLLNFPISHQLSAMPPPLWGDPRALTPRTTPPLRGRRDREAGWVNMGDGGLQVAIGTLITQPLHLTHDYSRSPCLHPRGFPGVLSPWQDIAGW